MPSIPLKLAAGALAVLLLGTESILATDACSKRAIVTAADVTVSDGTSFRTESFYHSPAAAAIRHHLEQAQVVVLEGPQSWTQVGEKAATGTDFHKLFVLSHQYHAMLLHFADFLQAGPAPGPAQLAGQTVQATTGEFIHGGTLSLTYSAGKSEPSGVVQVVPEGPTIESEFLDWRDVDGTRLPHRVRINDGERVFDYRYTTIDLGQRSPLWFFEALPAPPIDQVQLYRLHRTLLAAHCLGDAGLIARLSTPEVLLASRGELLAVTRAEIENQFQSVFDQIRYTAYSDTRLPQMSVAESGDLAWMGVEVLLQATVLESGATIEQQWAWIMLAEKSAGQWLHAGNGSSAMPVAGPVAGPLAKPESG